MKFKTVLEAFNYYKNMSVQDMEKRAQEINTEIDTDANADIEALNIELRGIKEAKENIELRAAGSGTDLKVIAGMDTKPGEKKEFGADVFDTKEYRSAFFKSMLGQELTEVEKSAYDKGLEESEKRADAFNNTTSAAAVLPTATLNEVIKKARTMGGLIAEARNFNVPTKVSIPVGTPSSKANWHTEGANVESEKATVASVSFDGYEILKVFSISAKVRKMSIAAFEAYIVDELVNCTMETIEDALVNGTGENRGAGLETITWNGTNSVSYANGSVPTFANVTSTVALLKRGYSKGAKWAMNNATLYNKFYNIVDGNKRPIFIADAQGDKIGKLLGFEVVIDDNIADGAAYFGNYQYLGYNIPEGIAVEASRESSFKKGLIDYRALAIADTKPVVGEAFVKLYEASK